MYGNNCESGTLSVHFLQDSNTYLYPTFHNRLTMDDLRLRDYSPWEGWKIFRWPTTAILCWKVMVDNGKMPGEPTDGQLVRWRIDPAVLRRPAF